MMAAIANATSVSIKNAPSEISHHHDQHDVNDGQQRKCVAEGPVHYVPEMEDFLGVGKKQHPLRDRCLFPRHVNGPLRVGMFLFKQPPHEKNCSPKMKSPPPKFGDLKRGA